MANIQMVPTTTGAIHPSPGTSDMMSGSVLMAIMAPSTRWTDTLMVPVFSTPPPAMSIAVWKDTLLPTPSEVAPASSASVIATATRNENCSDALDTSNSPFRLAHKRDAMSDMLMQKAAHGQLRDAAEPNASHSWRLSSTRDTMRALKKSAASPIAFSLAITARSLFSTFSAARLREAMTLRWTCSCPSFSACIASVISCSLGAMPWWHRQQHGPHACVGPSTKLLTTALDFQSSTLCRMRSSPMGPRMAAYHLPIFSWWLSISVFTRIIALSHSSDACWCSMICLMVRRSAGDMPTSHHMLPNRGGSACRLLAARSS
mmetsp:Transcript_20365/g.51275  ORF Transcript_20365/g.51275 Transcript_20365/m.51275 type:complete len:318 (+) Transcript_20365:1527-2480(+)